jgi:hypothetical protein
MQRRGRRRSIRGISNKLVGSQLGVVTEKLGVVRKLNVVRTALTTLNF